MEQKIVVTTIAVRRSSSRDTVSGDRRRPTWRQVRCLLCAVGLLAGSRAAAETKGPGADFDCILQPALSLKLSSPVASIIDQVLVDRGDVVTKGQIVARLESAVEAATVALDQVKADSTTEIASKQVRLDLAKIEFDRQTALMDRQVTSTQKFDEARANFKFAQQDLGLAALNHQVAGLDLQRSRAALNERVIRSPVDGVVTQRSLGPGEYVSQDAHILTVAEIDPIFVETFLPIRYYGSIKVDDVATVRPDAPVGGERKAVVSVVDQVFDAASGTFGIRLRLPNANHAVPAGLRCHVTFAVPDLPEPGGTEPGRSPAPPASAAATP